MARNYLQGKYTVKNREKYVGDANNVIYRSSWELKALIWMDNNINVLKFGSEEIVIPYFDHTTNKQRRYFVDFIIEYKSRDGTIKKSLIEIKPMSQTIPPKPRTRVTKGFISETLEYEKNRAKWAYARKWCEEHSMSFVILTEKELGIKR
jgi:hypothetical protein